MPIYQTLATLPNQSDCWLCQHLDRAKEPKLVFIPACVNVWGTKYRRSINGRVGYPGLENDTLPSSGESFRLNKISLEAQGLPFAQINIIGAKISLCIEKIYATGPFLGATTGQYYNQTLWFDSINNIFKSFKEIKCASNTTYSTHGCQITKCSGWFTGHPFVTWSISAAPLCRLLNTPDYI